MRAGVPGRGTVCVCPEKLKEDAEKFLGEPVTEAVISVPAYFDDDRRYATKNAGKLAGLYVERIVNEPSAVALRHQVRERRWRLSLSLILEVEH